MSSDKFAIELALARMAIVFMSRHKDDEGCARVVHQVRRLGHAYLVDDNDMDRGQKLARLIKWTIPWRRIPARRRDNCAAD